MRWWRNFLNKRTFHDIETPNREVARWLERTANRFPHAVTQKPPCSELELERPHLTPYRPHIARKVYLSTYAVRKDNTVSLKANFFSLPLAPTEERKPG